VQFLRNQLIFGLTGREKFIKKVTESSALVITSDCPFYALKCEDTELNILNVFIFKALKLFSEIIRNF